MAKHHTPERIETLNTFGKRGYEAGKRLRETIEKLLPDGPRTDNPKQPNGIKRK